MTEHIDIKSGCQFKRFTPQLADFIYAVCRAWDLYIPSVMPVITSANDGQHMDGSKHYSDEAWDLRIRNLEAGTIEEIARMLRVDLGKDWDIVVEKDHLHVEYDP